MNKLINKSVLIVNYLSTRGIESTHNYVDLIFWKQYFKNKKYKITGFHQQTPNKIFNDAILFDSTNKNGKISYLISLIKLIFKIPRREIIIFQTFEEISIVIYLILKSKGNKIFLVVSNNLTESRFQRKYIRLIYYIISRIKSVRIIVTCNTEKVFLSKFYPEEKIHIKRYYLSSEVLNFESTNRKIENSVFYPGPEKDDKPITSLKKFYSSEFGQSLKYIVFNTNYSVIKNKHIKIQINNKLETKELNDLIGSCEYMFLPHSKSFSPKFSGNFVDAIDNLCIIITNNIDSVKDYFDEFGTIGIIIDYDKSDFNKQIESQLNDLDKNQILQNLLDARSKHSLKCIYKSLDEIF